MPRKSEEAEEAQAMTMMVEEMIDRLRPGLPGNAAFAVVLWNRDTGGLTGGAAAAGGLSSSEVTAALLSLASRIDRVGAATVRVVPRGDGRAS